MYVEKLMELPNVPGDWILVKDIRKPEIYEWNNALVAMQSALQMEMDMKRSLLDLNKLSTQHTDTHLREFLESHYMDEQVKMTKKLGNHVNNLKRLRAPENDLGVYMFNKLSLE